jgi:hypothetical protein
MIPQGNVDTELGGMGQSFPPVAGGGNVQSDTAPINYALGYGRRYPQQPDPMQYYFQLGQQLLQQQMAMQQQMASQMGQMQGNSGGGNNPLDNSLNLGATGMLTSNFDPNWLASRLSAGSANGAKIGGITSGGGGGGGSGGEGWEDQGPPDNTTAGDSRIKGGFWNKTKDFFGWGKNNKFGFGR